MNAEPLDRLEAETMDLLDQATSMRVGLSENDSDYDLHFIADKLAKVGVYQERLSDIQMALTKIAIETTRQHRTLSAVIRLKEKEAKASDTYANLPTNEKAYWLENQQAELKERAGRWHALSLVVSEARSAVNERMTTMKRLDSDLRLHTKIYETKVAAGATSPSSYKGNNTNELEL